MNYRIKMLYHENPKIKMVSILYPLICTSKVDQKQKNYEYCDLIEEKSK